MAAVVESGRADTVYTAICFTPERMMGGTFLLQYFATFMDFLYTFCCLYPVRKPRQREMDEQSKLGRHFSQQLGQSVAEDVVGDV